VQGVERREYDKHRRERWTAVGLCDQCGKCPSAQGKKRCTECILYYALYHLKSLGMSVSELAKAQEAVVVFDNVCRACGRVSSCGTWCFDHCHSTLTFRGIVGMDCNLSMGRSGDNPDILRKQAEYLEKHKQKFW